MNTVASGIVPLALGRDAGGSIRIPSAFSGIVGLKATWHRIPLESNGGCWFVFINCFLNYFFFVCVCFAVCQFNLSMFCLYLCVCVCVCVCCFDRSTNNQGFLARTLRDQMIGYMAIAGGLASPTQNGGYVSNEKVFNSNPPPMLANVENYKSLKDLTVGIYKEWFNHADKQVIQK